MQPTRATYLLRRLIAVAAVVLPAAAIAVVAGVDASWLGSDQELGSASEVAAEPIADVPTPLTAAVPASVPAAVPASVPAAPSASVSAAVPAVLPDRASRFVSQTPERVLDTRDAAPLAPTESATIRIDEERSAVALSVSIVGAGNQGSVSIDGRAGIVDAAVAGAPGASTTNLVFVPMLGDELTVRSSTGGHLVIDVVGSFAEVNPGGGDSDSGGGRFVATPPTEVAKLVTKTDGREAILRFDGIVPAEGAEAVLVAVTADVGADGGVVRLGADDQFNQMLMWGPANGAPTRRGLVLLRPGSGGSASLRYDGGSVLTAEVVGYFTGDSLNGGQPGVSTAGLYLPSGPRKLFAGQLSPEAPAIVGGLTPLAETALVTAAVDAPGAGFGFPGSRLLPADQGTVTLAATASSDAEVTLLGVFLAREF